MVTLQYQKTEDHLRDSLLHADQEREQLLETNTALTGQLEELQDDIRYFVVKVVRSFECWKSGQFFSEEKYDALSTTYSPLQCLAAVCALCFRKLHEDAFAQQESKTDLEQQNLQIRTHLTAQNHKIGTFLCSVVPVHTHASVARDNLSL